MNTNILKLSLPLIFLLTTNVFANTENSPDFNPKASPDYDANLNVNDLAITVDQHLNLKQVKIFQKKDGLYQVGPKGISEWELKNKKNNLKWYKANSVYPYYDITDFNSKVGKYRSSVEPYLLCVAQKYKFPLETLTGKKSWPTYYLKDKAEYENQKKKLAELNDTLNGFENLPNTFLPYENNPFLWKIVAKNSDEYLNCLATVKNPEGSKIVEIFLRDINSSKKLAENFNGGTSGLYNSGSYNWLYRAVSQKGRKEFIATQKGWNTDTESVTKIVTALDDLKKVAVTKIGLLKMENSLFKYRDNTSEKLMKNYLKKPSSLKVYKIGLSDNNWIIEKNNFGIPLFRYKRGQMWVKNNSDDHGFCKGLFFEIRQNYNGGGSYAGSLINGYNEELYGCP